MHAPLLRLRLLLFMHRCCRIYTSLYIIIIIILVILPAFALLRPLLSFHAANAAVRLAAAIDIPLCSHTAQVSLPLSAAVAAALLLVAEPATASATVYIRRSSLLLAASHCRPLQLRLRS